MSPNPTGFVPSPPAVSKHPCVTCQRRKVKCDRQDPCTRCRKSGQDCKQPEAHRAPRRPRKKEDANVLDRVRQLEHSLEQMRTLVAKGKRSQDLKTLPVNVDDEAVQDSIDESRILEDSVGRLIIDDERTRYISGSSWANLTDQVEDLRTLLEDDESIVEDELAPKRTFTHYLSNGMFPSRRVSWEATYSQTNLGFLWQTYLRNIDPIMKVIHAPTTQPVIDGVLASTGEISKGTYCLLAAIKFAAITSLTDDECWAALNSARKPLLDLYRSEVQATLDAANFLATHSIITLQAYIIYQFCNRRHEHPRAMWVASGIAIRIAQSIGLHRDGALMRLPVLATEVRRRLFWEIRMIDLSCAEDCGFLPTHIYGTDTRLPLNINDSDIKSEDVLPPIEREGFTDMTYVLIRYQFCKQLHRLGHHEGKSSMGILEGDRQGMPQQAKALAECRSIIQTKYLQYCSPSIPIQKVTLWVGRIILLKQSLLSQYPLFHNSCRTTPISRDLTDELFETSCEILELSHEIISDPETFQWTWMLQTYIHWHPVAFLLNELCASPQHPLSIRGWSAIDRAFATPHGLSPEENQALWRPLRGLLEKAKKIAQRASPGCPDNVSPMSAHSANAHTSETSSQQQNSLAMFMPGSSLPPPGDGLMTFDFQTPFATMTDFMTNTSSPQFDMEAWWMGNDHMAPITPGL